MCDGSLLAELELILEIFGEGLIAAIGRRQSQISRHLDLACEWLREAARPPSGVRLVSDDGSLWSGVCLVERSELVWALMHRHVTCGGRGPTTPSPRSAPPVRSYPGPYVAPTDEEFAMSKYQVDPDDPLWNRDVDPYRR